MAKSDAKHVLFLCTGNYFRSRFAEILFNSIATKMGLSWRATSRGLALERGTGNVGPIARGAVQTLELMGIRDVEAFARMPMPVTHDEFVAAHRIVALKRTEHLPLMDERFPEWTRKVEFWHVNDAPDALGIIETEIMGLIARIVGGGERGKAVSVEAVRSATPVSDPKPAAKPITLKVGRETSGRRGKGVTTIFDAPMSESALQELAAKLKQKCGTGGTVKDARIEIQGDQRERIVSELEKLGFNVKRVGG